MLNAVCLRLSLWAAFALSIPFTGTSAPWLRSERLGDTETVGTAAGWRITYREREREGDCVSETVILAVSILVGEPYSRGVCHVRVRARNTKRAELGKCQSAARTSERTQLAAAKLDGLPVSVQRPAWGFCGVESACTGRVRECSVLLTA